MIKVLLVDDGLIFRRAIKQLLPEKDTITVVGECSDGRNVLEFLNNNDVDVILMDVSMKYMGGIEATKLIREKHENVKVIGFSSYSESSCINDMRNAGAHDYIVKGAEMEIVRKKIKALM